MVVEYVYCMGNISCRIVSMNKSTNILLEVKVFFFFILLLDSQTSSFQFLIVQKCNLCGEKLSKLHHFKYWKKIYAALYPLVLTRCLNKQAASFLKKQKRIEGPTGIRTQVARIRTLSDNQLHYGTLHVLLGLMHNLCISSMQKEFSMTFRTKMLLTSNFSKAR